MTAPEFSETSSNTTLQEEAKHIFTSFQRSNSFQGTSFIFDKFVADAVPEHLAIIVRQICFFYIHYFLLYIMDVNNDFTL